MSCIAHTLLCVPLEAESAKRRMHCDTSAACACARGGSLLSIAACWPNSAVSQQAHHPNRYEPSAARRTSSATHTI
eukprot:scaffold24806_cov129-Isochrysis_galbana.AAC.8